MKVISKSCEREFGRMKSVNENFYKDFIWKFPEATVF